MTTLPGPFHSLGEFVDTLGERRPDAPAFRFQQRTFTRAEVASRATAVAAGWRAAGYSPGDVIGVVGESGPAFVLAILSAGRAGLVPVLLDPRLTTSEIDEISARTRLCALAVCASATTPSVPRPSFAFTEDGCAALVACGADRAAPPLVRNSHAPALMLVTSGTSGHSRVVVLSAANLSSNIRAMAEVHPCDGGDVFLSVLPATHAFELTTGILGPLYCGGLVVFPESRNPNHLLQLLMTEGISHVNVVPAIVQMVVRELQDKGLGQQAAAFLFSRIRSIVCGGAPMAPGLVELLVRHHAPVWVGYGLTETSPSVAAGRIDAVPAGSVGRALPGIDLRVDDATGELLVRGPNVMIGYAGEPDATAGAIDGGWLRTGDVARIDADGFVFIVGRLRDLIVTSAGTKIAPERIESLYQSPLFAEVCAVGVPDDEGGGGERPHLLVRAASGQAPTTAALYAEFRRLSAAAGDARASGMTVIDAPLPRTRTMKVRRDLVARTFRSHARVTSEVSHAG